MPFGIHLLGALMVVSGLVAALWPRKVAKLNERLDAIGSKRSWSEVEPADWGPPVVRFLGSVLAGFGVLVIVTSAL